VLKSAIIAELYGVERIGMIRSLFTVVMVLSTAAGPVLFGVLLDAGLGFDHIIIINAVLLFLVMLNSFRIKYHTSNLSFKTI